MKKILKRISIILLSSVMFFLNINQIFAYNSTVYVYATQNTTFDITIPKKLVLSGSDGSGGYTVSVKGNLAGTDIIRVKPDKSFIMHQKGKEDINTTVTQNKTEFSYADGIRTDTPVDGLGVVRMDSMSAGRWNGTFYFNIECDIDENLVDSVGSTIDDIDNNVIIGQDITQNMITEYYTEYYTEYENYN